MKSNFDEIIGEKQEFTNRPNYENIFNIIKEKEVVDSETNENWNIDDLEKELTGSLKLSGERALAENNGVIYTTLSGGIDSTLALALLRKNFPEAKIVTITMGGDKDHPDIKYAHMAAKQYHSEHKEIIPNKNEIHSSLLDYKKQYPDCDLEQTAKTGDFDVYLLYENISKLGPKSVITHDGIDELMGGYWDHKKELSADERKYVFKKYWGKLRSRHLEPLIRTSQLFNIRPIFTYLNKELVDYISKIPVDDRASNNIGKKPLRAIAKKIGVPQEIIDRLKRGQVGMMEIEKLREKKS